MLARGNKRKAKSARAASFGVPESPTIAHRRQRLQRVFVVSAFITLVVATTDVPDFRDQTGRYEIEDEAYASSTVTAESLFDNVVHGAPVFAPLLFANLALLSGLGVWTLLGSAPAHEAPA